jgi:hypothetical protein
MPGGKRGHKLREFMRPADAVLEDERGRLAPIPPPINAEHGELRRLIAETCAEIELDPESRDAYGRPVCTPEGATTALRALDLMFEERDLLMRAGVDWRLYQPDSFR